MVVTLVIVTVIRLPPCVSNTPLHLPHLLRLNELRGLVMTLLRAENATEKEVSFLSAWGTERKQTVGRCQWSLARAPHMWEKRRRVRTCPPVCSHYPKYTDVCTCKLMSFFNHFHRTRCTWCCLFGCSWPLWWLARRWVGPNRTGDFLWLSVRRGRRKCHQLRFYDVHWQSSH